MMEYREEDFLMLKGGVGNDSFCSGHVTGQIPERRSGYLSAVFPEIICEGRLWRRNAGNYACFDHL